MCIVSKALDGRLVLGVVIFIEREREHDVVLIWFGRTMKWSSAHATIIKHRFGRLDYPFRGRISPSV